MVTVVVVAAGVAIVLWRTVLAGPPAQRHVTLSALAGTTWASDVLVSYTGLGADTLLLRLEMGESRATPGGATVSASVWVSPRTVPGAAGEDAHVDVGTLGSMRPDAAVASIVASERELGVAHQATVTPVANLPAGWQGLVTATETGRDGDAELVGATGGTLVRISIRGFAAATTVARDGAQLASAIAGWGIPRFSSAISRPRGWW